MSTAGPTVIILAGPNGAGKTTSARTLLAETLSVMTYVNADVIAQGLSGFDPDSAAIEASRIMLERLRALAAQRVDFAFETTLAARTYAGWLRELRETGHSVQLTYFGSRVPTWPSPAWRNGYERAVITSRKQRFDGDTAAAWRTSLPSTCPWPIVGRLLTTAVQCRPERWRSGQPTQGQQFWTRPRGTRCNRSDRDDESTRPFGGRTVCGQGCGRSGHRERSPRGDSEPRTLG